MTYLKILFTIIGVLTLVHDIDNSIEAISNYQHQINPLQEKVQVLNFGTFHMGFTTDANTTEFDEHDRENQKKVHEIAEKLSAFEPTVILVETPPEQNEKLREAFFRYKDNPDMFFENPSEIELLAFELGRLSGTERIYGIDHKMRYNYMIGQFIMTNDIDPERYDAYSDNLLQFFPSVDVDRDNLNLLEKLKLTNHDRYLDFLITVNADRLTYTANEGGFEGADEAAKYYQRNLRMYSNLHRVNLDEDDRVFILMGASHTAFFRDFMSRDPKYEMVDTFDYLIE
ncbi:hypothetical protein DYD21_10150 [Rhodohalobacter sp. SW132]|uniref:DUF5694 domain-containing protein n=1 Tax=Rhodohalobacter sp. SW132 TaxID=2293433 RepID=UPI000E23CC0F|nr:DUF5694 domain-containing protein [Rhodohalobacter sp. SW132]REL33758.1 hypothetical protein DYD21_10150 [Rhodohalobacter sp. SW132]